jgi:succinoglycan biosynthesis protein ExoO
VTKRVSYIVACFNSEPYLRSAVESILAQSVADLEVLICDDCSSDGSIDIAQRLSAEDSRVSLIRSDVNRGPSAARNTGIAYASGDWIAVLDSDDSVAPTRTEELLDLGESTSSDIVADNLKMVDGDTETELARAFEAGSRPYSFVIQAPDYIRSNAMLTPGFKLGYLKPMIRSTSLRKLNVSYDERFRIAEDYHLCLRMLLAGARFVTSSIPSYNYRIRRGSLSRSLGLLDVELLLSAHREIRRSLHGAPGDLISACLYHEQCLERVVAFTRIVKLVKSRNVIAAAREAAVQRATWPLLARSAYSAARKRIFSCAL